MTSNIPETRFYECCECGEKHGFWNPYNSGAWRAGVMEMLPFTDCPYCPEREKALRKQGLDLGKRPGGAGVWLKRFSGDWEQLPVEGKNAILRIYGAFDSPGNGGYESKIWVRYQGGNSCRVAERSHVSDEQWISGVGRVISW